MSQSSIYQPLDEKRREFRLLILELGAESDPICCRLKLARLSRWQKSVYETVSYVWGDSSQRAHIQLHGHQVDIPVNAVGLLQHFRLSSEERVLWIDVVCINQSDFEERASQVALMGDIYENTKTNLIWLGEDEKGNAAAAKASIESLAKEFKLELDKGVELWTESGNFIHSQAGSGPHLQIAREAMLDLYSNVWFSRLWVVQEAALAPYSICHRGDASVPLNDVLRAACWVRRTMLKDPGLAKLVLVSANALTIFKYADAQYGFYSPSSRDRKRRARDSMLELLWRLQQFGSSNPKDHIYGVIGIYRKQRRLKKIPPSLTPNYLSSLEDTFTAAARYIIADRGNLDLLSHVSHTPDRASTPTMPSWVPRWDWKHDEYVDSFRLCSSDFRAANRVLLRLRDISNKDPRVLPVRGFSYERVSDVTDVMRFAYARDTTGSAGIEAYLDTAYSKIQHCTSQEDEEVTQALAITCTTETDFESLRLAASESVRLYNAFRQYLTETHELPFFISSSNITAAERDIYNYFQAMYSACDHRRFFMTSAGHFGLGPATTLSGDVIAILYGSDMPLVLRPVDSSPGYYKLVGECYMRGIMHGEAVRNHKADRKADKLFHLI